MSWRDAVRQAVATAGVLWNNRQGFAKATGPRAIAQPNDSSLTATAILRAELRQSDSSETRDRDLAWRVIRSTSVIRILVSALLFGFFVAFDDPKIVGDELPRLYSIVAALYFLFSLGTALIALRELLPLKLTSIVAIAVDIVAIVLLMHASGGIASGIGGLLVVFVAASLIADRGATPYFVPAVATIALLIEQGISQLAGQSAPSQYTATGILGAILFAIPLLTAPLAKRLLDSEALLRQRGVDLANMARLNQYVVQHLRESIVALDSDDTIRLLNPSAAELLGAPTNATGMALADVAPELARRVEIWREGTNTQQPAQLSMTGADGSSLIEINIAPFARHNDGPSPILLFMEDTSVLAERVQQSKLASLGRLSASIAHEIRNPIGAMSHAGQLLAEVDQTDDTQQRLTDIICSNAARVSEIVDNVLQLSRRDTGQREKVRLLPWLAQFADEFVQTVGLNEGEIRLSSRAVDLHVLVDPSHLRQVLWNLCDNAVKYASDSGGILVELTPGRVESTGRPYLDIADHGKGIDPALIDHIFEPFFTARQGGTGLGLYIARELCELNGAALSYRPGAHRGSVFRIVFADPARWRQQGPDL
ncbi:MAG: ATP-binding protein [Pseudomonadota bacterium]